VVVVAAASWSGYRVYTKQPIVPPVVSTKIKAVVVKAKGAFK
jgi:hypothetical protein